MADRLRNAPPFGQGGAPHPAVLQMALAAMGCQVTLGACEVLVLMGPDAANRALRAMYPDFDERVLAARKTMAVSSQEARQ